MKESVREEKPGPIIHYIVDGTEQSTTVRMLSPEEILETSGIDPETHRLAIVREGRRVLCDEQPIRIHDEMRFVSVEREEAAEEEAPLPPPAPFGTTVL